MTLVRIIETRLLSSQTSANASSWDFLCSIAVLHCELRLVLDIFTLNFGKGLH